MLNDAQTVGSMKNNTTIRCMYILMLFLFADLQFMQAQSGRIEGFVYDTASEKPIKNAIVVVLDSDLQVLTDGNGRYFLRNVQPGQQALQVSMPGYSDFRVEVMIEGSEVLRYDFPLSFEFAEGDREQQVNMDKQWAGVYGSQSHSLTIGHSLTSSEMIRTGDYNVAGGVARMPGVHVGRFGEINLRGAGRERYGVQINGLPVAASNVNGRNTDLGLFSTDLVSSATITGITAPDMDASGLGGVVQLHTWQPAGVRDIAIYAGGMALSDYNILNGLGRVAALSYSERFTEQFAMSAQLSHQMEVNGFESLGLDFGVADFGSGFVDVVERISPALHSEKRNRTSGKLQFGYQPALNSHYFLLGIFGADNFETEAHFNNSIANGDWIDQTTTGIVGQRGVFQYNPRLSKSNTNYSLVQAGGEHHINSLLVKYTLGWSNTYRELNNFDFLFGRDRLNYSVDLSDRSRPEMIITNIPLMSDGSVDQRTMNFDAVNRIRNEQLENRYSARLDITAPLAFFRFKLGSSVQYSQSERKFEDATLSTLRRYSQIRFQKIPRSTVDVLDRYYYPDLADTRLAARYVDTSRPDMRLSEDDMFRRSLPGNYEMDEAVFAGYIMTNATLGALKMAAGVRSEITKGDYTGRNVLFNQFGFYDSSSDTSAATDYTDIFPYAAISFRLTDRTNLKAAYSKSIERPDHDILAPFELILPADTLRFKGNPNLKPILSDNAELMIEHFFKNLGQISFGMFYNQYTNFIYYQEQRVQAADFPFQVMLPDETLSVNERSYVNSDQSVEIYGAIINWNQRLDFLPGPLRNLGILANYTYTYSDTHDKRDMDDVYLRHVSPHVMNAALSYNRNRFLGQITWHWSAPSLTERASQRQWAPEISRTEQVYIDRYEDGWSDLSVQVGYRISDNFRFWANINNLLAREHNMYSDSDKAYLFNVSRMSGVMVSAGIRFTY
jgi:TonB-dependent receptor